jgi:transposase-like protein
MLGMGLVRHVCVDCKTRSPETEESFSLLGLAGWRQQKVKSAEGQDEIRWRCGACWSKFKRATGGQTQRSLPTLDIVAKLDAAKADPKKR